jgi:ABC-type glycerol-3-phosphate transport system substrate-binding protein
MWILTLSERGGLMWPVEWNTAWGMVDLPSDAEPVTPVWAEGYAISASTHHPDACWQWLVFLTWQMHHRLIPARRSLAESDAYNELVGDEMANVVRASLEHAVPYSPEIWTEFAPAMEAFSAAVNDIIEDESTVHEALDDAQRRAYREVE